MRKRLIIDTDPGHDDALAIMLLDKSKLFEIEAITTVAGNSSIENTTNNAKFIMDLIGCTAPLYSGASKPIKRDLIKAEVHGTEGLDGAKIIKNQKLTKNASRKIIEIVRKYPNEVSILAIGPLTNIARAFLLDPELPKLIREIVIMGGAIEVPGNKNRVGEFNIFVDPDAADMVFRSTVKKILIPLDACNPILLSIQDFKQISNIKLRMQLLKMMHEYGDGILKFENTKGLPMYDPLAAYYLINPNAYETSLMDIEIETTSDLTRGMTVADRRIWGEKKPNIEVVMKINKQEFIHEFIKTLNK